MDEACVVVDHARTRYERGQLAERFRRSFASSTTRSELGYIVVATPFALELVAARSSPGLAASSLAPSSPGVVMRLRTRQIVP
jgi:hypothetical protein